MITVTIYASNDDLGVKDLLKELESKQERIPNRTVVIDVNSDESFRKAYQGVTPVIQVGPYVLKSPFTQQELDVALGAAHDRSLHMESVGDDRYARRVKQGSQFSKLDKFSYWLSKHYMHLFNLFFFLYTALPFAAPVMMKANIPGPANAIYSVYGTLCHQLAFRSWFLYGEQAYYPRSLAGISGVQTYEQVMGSDFINIEEARTFNGNVIMGYKVALCQRDIGIYGSIFLFGMIFTLTGKKIKPISWIWWFVLGLIPIGIDGVSQLPGIAINLFPSWFPIRESTPLLRSATGVLFGTFTAWYLYPLIEESMSEMRSILYRKKVVVEQTSVESAS